MYVFHFLHVCSVTYLHDIMTLYFEAVYDYHSTVLIVQSGFV